MSYIGANALEGTGLTNLYVKNATPCTLGDLGTFNAGDCKLWVPVGAESAYQDAENWSEFTTIGTFTPTSVDGVATSEIKVYSNGSTMIIAGLEGQNVAIYNISGMLMHSEQANDSTMTIDLMPGAVYIVKVDSQVMKVKM